MSAWGPAIFSDDFACDIRDDYVSLLYNGRSEEEALKELMDIHYKDIKDTDDEAVFWFALALTQWNNGILINEVRDNALEFIHNGSDLLRWNIAGNEKNYKKRIEALKKLEITLTSPMPAKKKIRKPSWVWTSPWPKGALLCYKVINSRCPKEHIDKYILARVVNVNKHKSSGFISEDISLGFYGWIGDEIPDKDIIKQLEFIDLEVGKSDMLGKVLIRFYRTYISKKEIKERNIVCLECDENYDNSEFFNDGWKNVSTPMTVIDFYFTTAYLKYIEQKNID